MPRPNRSGVRRLNSWTGPRSHEVPSSRRPVSTVGAGGSSGAHRRDGGGARGGGRTHRARRDRRGDVDARAPLPGPVAAAAGAGGSPPVAGVAPDAQELPTGDVPDPPVALALGHRPDRRGGPRAAAHHAGIGGGGGPASRPRPPPAPGEASR